MQLSFLGGVGTVTGSKYLLDTGVYRILVDCGLFQGFKQFRLRNWEALPVAPRSIDAVVLTHAHIDHSGYLPLLVRSGFKGPVLCTPTTRDLCGILLPDAGFLQEQDAAFANRQGFSKHHPALPLYTERDARNALQRLVAVPYGENRELGDGFRLAFRDAGHILGSAIATLRRHRRSVVFSGDLGRPGSPLLPDPATVSRADYLVVESTYGDRRHSDESPEDAIAAVVNRAAGRGGTVLIPAFAVGRTQLILYYLQRLKAARRIPNISIFIDSPMAIEASTLLYRHHKELRLSAAECDELGRAATYVRDVEGSKALDQSQMPKVVISASGMATGGRVLHHLKALAPDPRNAILFAGFQAGGTRGAAMVGGAATVKIHGGPVLVRAEIVNLDMLSAHADSNEIMAWLRQFEAAPRRTFVTHGEPAAADALRHRIEEELGWECRVPDYRETFDLDGKGKS